MIVTDNKILKYYYNLFALFGTYKGYDLRKMHLMCNETEAIYLFYFFANEAIYYYYYNEEKGIVWMRNF